MKLLIELPSNQQSRIQHLLNKNLYSDLNSFIIAAVENQLHLEHYGLNDSIVLKNEKADWGTRMQDPRISQLPEEIEKSIQFIKPPTWSDLCIETNISEEHTWTWGQINRMFPTKVVLRFLLNKLYKKYGSGMRGNKIWTIPLEEFIEGACEIARVIGIAISKVEVNERGKKISAALPIGEDVSKAQTRFKNHFLITIRKDGILSGALAQYKFVNVNYEKNGSYNIGISEAGFDFAMLENTVLNENFKAENAFSKEESTFLISHFKREVRGEYNSMLWVLEKINQGTDNPDSINQALNNYSDDKDFRWSKSVINTYRAGLISRVREIGFIERIKEGIEVKYKLTELGKDLLQPE